MAVAQRAREAVVNVAVLSNSFGMPYNPYEALWLYDCFDTVIISEVEKVRKPRRPSTSGRWSRLR